MYCKFCGMDSRDTRVCEWCKKPLAAGAAAPMAPMGQPLTGQPLGGSPPPMGMDLTQPVSIPLDLTQPVPPPTPGTEVRVSLTGEVMEVPQPAARPMPGTFTPPSPIAPRARPGGVTTVPGVIRDLPTTAVTAQMVQQAVRFEDDDLGERWDKCLALILPTILVAVLAAHFAPAQYLWIECGALFLSALFMGATRSISSYDEAFVDCTAVLVISYFLGPLIGFGLYLVYGLVRSEPNAAINFLGITHIVTRGLLILAASTSNEIALYTPELDFKMILPHVAGFTVGGIVSFFVICATFAGWMMSSFFRPVDE